MLERHAVNSERAPRGLEDRQPAWQTDIGVRDANEDRFICQTLDGELNALLASLSDQAIQDCLRQTCADINEYINTHCHEFKSKDKYGFERMSGAAGLVVLLHQNALWLLNLGDCALYSVVNEESKKKITQLNTLHRPTEEQEKERLRQGKFTVYGPKLGGVLEMSRAFGDTVMLKNGLSQEPEIKKVNLAQPAKKQILILATDGLYDYKDFTTEDLLEGIDDLSTPKSLCAAMVQKARLKGSKDNITILIADLNQVDPHARIMACFDGHNGEKVANYLAEHFYKRLAQTLRDKRYSETVQPLVYTSTGEPSVSPISCTRVVEASLENLTI